MLAKTVKEYQELNGWIISAILAAGAAIDIVIALSMVHFLMSKKQTGLGQCVLVKLRTIKSTLTLAFSVSQLVDRLVTYAIREWCLDSYSASSLIGSQELAS